MRETIATTRAPAVSAPAATRPPTPRLLEPAVWRDAALVWVAQRALVVLFAWIGAHAINPRLTPGDMVDAWTRWDSGFYTSIAQGGYIYQWQVAFYPLLPGLERLLMLSGLSPLSAGMLIANLSALGAFGLLRALIERELGPAAARRSLLYLALFPTAFYLIAPYTEALFLLLSAACFIALRRKRWLLAGGFAALAALTRPFGVLLIAPMLVEYLMDWRARGWRAPRGSERNELARLLGAVMLPALAVAGFYLVLTPLLRGDTPFQIEHAGWGRDLAPPGAGFLRVGAALLTTRDPFQIAHILLDSAFVALFIALTLTLWRRLPPAYVAYAGVTLLLVLMTPTRDWYAFASDMRYMLPVFPLFMRLGQWGAKPWANRLILGLSLPLLALLVVIFTVGGWVA